MIRLIPTSLLGSALLASAAAAAPSTPQLASLTRAQFVAAMDAEFRKLDLDNDHVASAAEIAESQRKAQEAAAVARLDNVFKQLDKDGDGKLSPAEFRAIAAAEKPAADPAPLLSRFDSNHDGKIGIVEYRAATQANFDRIDTDRDGVVSPQEIKLTGVPN
jgi:Ca2+-binding EF-hand superfamily protein